MKDILLILILYLFISKVSAKDQFSWVYLISDDDNNYDYYFNKDSLIEVKDYEYKVLINKKNQLHK